MELPEWINQSPLSTEEIILTKISVSTSAKGGDHVTVATDLEGETLTLPPPHPQCCWCAGVAAITQISPK